MSLIDILSAFFICFIIAGLGVCVFFTFEYADILGVIKTCNSDFGVGNWTFTENHTWAWTEYSCESYHSHSYITQSITQTCTSNGKEVDCGSIK
jgi:hypothetical protein